jgi:hypothetical protein
LFKGSKAPGQFTDTSLGVQKNNLLSEISEEETDAVSMISERKPGGGKAPIQQRPQEDEDVLSNQQAY